MLAITLFLAIAPEYPLASGFVPASPANYVAGAMQTPQYVIIHEQDGIYAGTIGWFQDPASGVSTQYVMRSSDGEITQMVRHADMAQHIGGYNPISFGIEHEGYIDEPGWYTWETYTASAKLTRWLCEHFAIPVDRQHILGHVEVPGASHTDPGADWEWGMYMALVEDVVPEGRVEGVLVDRSAACVITAIEDTWITTTLETLDALDDDEMCFLAAGTELEYLHASAEMVSQRRLQMDGAGPCAGIGELDTLAYIWMPSFSEPCAPEQLAVTTDVVVTLDGIAAPIDAQGRFVIEGVLPGAHTLDVASPERWAPVSVPIDVAVYPGLRVVIPLDRTDAPEPDPDTSSDGAPSSDEAGAPSTDSTTTTSGSDEGHGGEGSDGAEASISGADQSSSGDSGGCGCSTDAPRPAGLLALLWLGALRRRRALTRRA